MKTTTIFKSILFSLLTLVNIIWTQEVQAQEQRCVIDYIEFSPFNENTVNSQSFAEQDYAERILIDDLTTTVIVHPKNPAHCVGKNFNLSIASDYNATSALIVRDYTFNSEGKFSAKLYPGENVCSAPTGASNYCRYYAVLSHFWYGKYETFSSSSIITPRPPQNSLHLPTQYPDTDIKEDKGTIVYKKIGDGKKRWTQNRTNTSSTQNCTILFIFF